MDGKLPLAHARNPNAGDRHNHERPNQRGPLNDRIKWSLRKRVVERPDDIGQKDDQEHC